MPADPYDIATVALLEEPARRALYDAVVASGGSLGRDDAARLAGVSRGLAAFHLDKLVAAGLLDVEFRRLSGRTGPGAGRPSKLYRRGSREVGVSLPDRHYEVPAAILASTIEQLAGRTPREASDSVARDLGRRIGATARRQSGPRPSRRRLRAMLAETLETRGYEPSVMSTGEIRLRNCPFHALVEDHRDLVCGINLALAEGILEGLGDRRAVARLDPQPGFCCVAIAEAPRRGHQGGGRPIGEAGPGEGPADGQPAR